MDASNLSDKQKKQIAVAHFAGSPDSAPAECKVLLEKLIKYSNSANQCQRAMDEAQRAYGQMEEILKKSIGGIEAITDVIADMLTDDIVNAAVEKFEPPKMNAPEFDMAGSTAQNMPPPPPVK